MDSILIVEDEIKIAELLQDYLKQSGYETWIVNRGDEVVPWLKKKEVDMILLDLMLPGMHGIEVCREIRKFSEVPIIMVTAQTEEIDRLLGLELGADDYISKPFSPREVVARVKAVLRRARQPVSAEDLLKTGGIKISEETHQIWLNDQEVTFTPVEFGLLKVLLSRPERVFTREELLNKVQGYDFMGYDRTIDTHVKNLRKKLAKHGIDDCIVSIYGVGYRYHVSDV
ncbi:MAG: response regulator [SAR324 cluster bacterium]|nr:response regulator [SAR324 cluster bacterium]MBL7034736.1 response regulator [SAR324 cluster bacterium]